ncbi:phenylacetate-CoA ligase [Catenulispora acidiphila DSM 44928]|uniref:Phenylacetate-coenzyme A ligase n=1 Tax=Catenulispora acidiphila (strain DSM 44928 / JCM 14897 / NBRC 102108 / NRRL B-24433 / ID139908) TaxID=479433 RepID=C7QIF9_CATAD|nr:phenylacetate--CoA ligase PaaK [Catenulispora acidiphila]ACU75036.1 phenylacetate-CoA ligase [Catenulispora acidiphila DSM 44928]
MSSLPEIASRVLDDAERTSVGELRALQTERMAWSLNHAYANVPHYTAAFDAAGVHPRDFKELADLKHFPFTAKKDLRDNYPFGMFAVPREHVARIHASSGTTGKATVVGYTAADLENWASVGARSLRAAGVRPGDRVHVAYGYGLFTGGLGVHYGAEVLGCTVIPISGGQTARQVQLIQDFEPDVICVTPSYLLAIVDEMEKQGIDPASTSLRIAVLGAEPWTDAMRAEIEERLAVHAVDIYGLSEVMGPGVGNEDVAEKDGTYLWEDHFYPEIVDPETGEVLPDGAKGELVFTSLTKQAMPVVRYLTRDLTRLLPGLSRPMRRMERITGRSDDMMIVRGVNLFPSQIEEELLTVAGLAPHFVCVLTRPGRLDELCVRVEAREAEVDRGAAAGRLASGVKERFGVTITVDVLDPGGLERSQGKAQRILDLRGDHT